MRLRHNLSKIETWAGRTWKWSHGDSGPPCYVTASCSWPVIMRFPASARVKGEKNIVSLPSWAPHKIWTHKNTDLLLSFQHQSSDMFNHMNLEVTDTWPLLLHTFWPCYPLPTCSVNHCQVHRGSMTHEAWLVAAHCFMQPLDMLRAAPFGCYPSSIFSECVMSPVLDLSKAKHLVLMLV